MKHSVRTSFAAGLLILLLLGSCANGGQESDLASAVSDGSPVSASAASGAENEDEADDPAPLSDAAVSEEAADEAPEDPPAAEEEPAALGPEETLKIAMEYIGRPVADLISVIGEPGDRDYAPSCMGPGEDGNLYYDGFIVYTYLEDGEETIQDVE